jgi:hypothetical protein
LTTPSKADDEVQDILWAAHLASTASSDQTDVNPSPSPDDATATTDAATTPRQQQQQQLQDPFKDWPRPPVRTTPTKGDAVVFFHNHPNGEADPYVWHAGCLPISNDKWTMQKFKEMPMSFRN